MYLGITDKWLLFNTKYTFFSYISRQEQSPFRWDDDDNDNDDDDDDDNDDDNDNDDDDDDDDDVCFLQDQQAKLDFNGIRSLKQQSTCKHNHDSKLAIVCSYC